MNMFKTCHNCQYYTRYNVYWSHSFLWKYSINQHLFKFNNKWIVSNPIWDPNYFVELIRKKNTNSQRNTVGTGKYAVVGQCQACFTFVQENLPCTYLKIQYVIQKHNLHTCILALGIFSKFETAGTHSVIELTFRPKLCKSVVTENCRKCQFSCGTVPF